MPIAKRLCFLAAVAVMIAGGVSTSAREDHIAQGQLLRIDVSAKKIVIQTAEGSRMQCSFNGETRVIGSDGTIAQLPAKSRLTVHYAKDQMEFVATEIEVHEFSF